MGWFGRRRRSETVLIRTILQAETKRQEIAQLRAEKEHEVELKKLELEMAHLEQLGEERRKDAQEKEKLKQQRAEWAATARQKKAQKASGVVSGVQSGNPAECAVCKNPSDIYLTATEIKWHHAGHPPGFAIPARK